MEQLNNNITNENIQYLKLLLKQYPSISHVYTEIINLRAILNLPKGTEHFISDVHGEYEAFKHIINNCSGVIREKVVELFEEAMTEQELSEFCTLIYYPEQKLRCIKENKKQTDIWYNCVLLRMIELCKTMASKYTRSKVRKAMPKEFAYIMDELLHADLVDLNQAEYHGKIIESILALAVADDFIIALAKLIKRLAVDKLHIVGDIFDRGPRPDLIMDMLCEHHSVDIQWGNHDILWMGAGAGSKVCMAAVIFNSASYGNLKVLENGYGINLRPLALFAERTYSSGGFSIKDLKDNQDPNDLALSLKICKAISIIMFKLEGQLWDRRPEYKMQDRMLLHHLDLKKNTIKLDNHYYRLKDADFPTVMSDDPYRLTKEESVVIEKLFESFIRSEKLARHIEFLYKKGSMYKASNQTLVFHGCIPLDEEGEFLKVELWNRRSVSGKSLLDEAQSMALAAYYGTQREKEKALDGMWYLWCGKGSPLFGRARMTSFERIFIEDASTWTEEKNPYYRYIQMPETCNKILTEFGLSNEISHIINGHVPVRASDGESPVKAGGKLIVIDGGFCKAYQPTTGIAGYTLIFNSQGMRLSAHAPFHSSQRAVEENLDIHSSTDIFETLQQRLRVMDTQAGEDISGQIYALSLLLEAYKTGIIQI